MANLPTPIDKLIYLFVVGFVVAFFLLANDLRSGSAPLFYILVGLVTLFLLILYAVARGGAVQGIGNNIIKHAALGGVLGAVFIAMHALAPASIILGLPTRFISLTASETTVFLVAVVLASIFEEGLFRQLIFKLQRKRMGFFVSAISNAILFSAFHMLAYQQTDAFVGAFIFGLIACYLTEQTGDMVASTVAHMVINGFLLISPFVIIGRQIAMFLPLLSKKISLS